MRIRCIKPEFWVSESIGRLSREARLLFIGLWSFADDSGRARGVFAAISGTLFPYDSDALQLIPKWFAELEREGMVFRYKAEDGNTYYQLPNWLKHQKIEKPSASKIPAFTEDSPKIHRILPEGYPLDQGSGNGSGIRDQGSIARQERAEVEPDASPKKQREPNLAWDALCEVSGNTGPLTPTEGGKIGKSLREIKSTCPGMEQAELAAEIRTRAARYKALFPGASLTDRALVGHWSKLATDLPAVTPGEQAPASQAISPNVLIIQWTKELDDCQEKLDAIRYSYDGHQAWARDDVERYNRILARKKELAALLKRKE